MKCSELHSEYIGRFAPSPTGLMHMGSLLAAIASYCEAMHKNGKWLVRIEDLDPPREVIGASQSIVSTLKNFGFKFDQKIIYQSQRSHAYDEALEKLEAASALYFCSCSRTELKKISMATHSCRENIQRPATPYNIKLKVPENDILFIDQIQGKYQRNLLNDCGDFVLKRKDGLYAYQLAVVVDDNYQQISNIVRGVDLLDSTPWQIYLNKCLGFAQADYAHIPILVNHKGQKLSKQTFAKEITNENALDVLCKTYEYLNQLPFIKRPDTIKEFWRHVIAHWDINRIAKIESIQVKP